MRMFERDCTERREETWKGGWKKGKRYENDHGKVKQVSETRETSE